MFPTTEIVTFRTSQSSPRRVGYVLSRRRGVEAIVLSAKQPSRIRGGARLGGAGPLENFVGDVAKYVVSKAGCRVIVTAPPKRGSESHLPPAEEVSAAR